MDNLSSSNWVNHKIHVAFTYQKSVWAWFETIDLFYIHVMRHACIMSLKTNYLLVVKGVAPCASLNYFKNSGIWIGYAKYCLA